MESPESPHPKGEVKQKLKNHESNNLNFRSSDAQCIHYGSSTTPSDKRFGY